MKKTENKRTVAIYAIASLIGTLLFIASCYIWLIILYDKYPEKTSTLEIGFDVFTISSFLIPMIIAAKINKKIRNQTNNKE